MFQQWQKAADYMLGDYYPLSPYSLANTAWIAWQFDRPEQGRGMIQAFRRQDSPYESARFSLHGLEPDAHYVVSNIDTGKSQKLTGRELAAPGLLVTAPAQPSAMVLYYEKEKGR